MFKYYQTQFIMLINLTNHPSVRWSDKQKAAAEEYGEVVDMSFPQVEASADEQFVKSLAKEYLEKIKKIVDDNPVVVHVMGEMTFTYSLVSLLKSEGIVCVASTSERIVNEFENGKKEVVFQFNRFRRY